MWDVLLGRTREVVELAPVTPIVSGFFGGFEHVELIRPYDMFLAVYATTNSNLLAFVAFKPRARPLSPTNQVGEV